MTICHIHLKEIEMPPENENQCTDKCSTDTPSNRKPWEGLLTKPVKPKITPGEWLTDSREPVKVEFDTKMTPHGRAFRIQTTPVNKPDAIAGFYRDELAQLHEFIGEVLSQEW
jgi:hypothetical protein